MDLPAPLFHVSTSHATFKLMGANASDASNIQITGSDMFVVLE